MGSTLNVLLAGAARGVAVAIVEDDPMARRSARRFPTSAGYRKPWRKASAQPGLG
jgi:hypothetical protein